MIKKPIKHRKLNFSRKALLIKRECEREREREREKEREREREKKNVQLLALTLILLIKMVILKFLPLGIHSN